MKKIVLASGSKQRREIMDYIGIEYDVIKSDIDECSNANAPYDYVMELAKNKGHNVKEKMHEDAIIIACDTVIFMDGKIYEKPTSKEEAYRNITEMCGNKTIGYTGVCIIDMYTGKEINYYDEASLTLRDDISEDEIKWYVDNEDNLLERCGYTILGKAIIFIDEVSGDYNTILGLSASSLIIHLKELGYSINDFKLK